MDIADFEDPYGVFGKKIIRHSPRSDIFHD